jgi:hypothetical protein
MRFRFEKRCFFVEIFPFAALSAPRAVKALLLQRQAPVSKPIRLLIVIVADAFFTMDYGILKRPSNLLHRIMTK